MDEGKGYIHITSAQAESWGEVIKTKEQAQTLARLLRILQYFRYSITG